jgi:glycosyltransferase involved in cell wall biosynthesis
MRDTGPKEVWSLLRELQRHGTAVVMADGPRDLRLCAYATFPLRIPVVYRFNLNHRRARNHLSDRLYFRRVRSLVFQSEFARTLAYRQSPWMRRAPAPQIPNGYDTARFAPDVPAGRAFRASLGIPPEAILVVTPGKLARNKGHDLAFDALRRLDGSAHAPDAYVVLGDGIREQELKSLARDLPVPTWFTGFLSPEGVAAALNAADLVVHPSSHEIFPNAVGEAMACGRPVVAMDAGGTPELVGSDGVAGVLVPPRDPDALAHAIGALLGDGYRRAALGAAARERIVQAFPLRRMIDGYERVFSQLVAAGRR